MTAAPVVSQAARDAAVRYALISGRLHERDAERARSGGDWDEWDCIQAFARFEAQSTAPLIEALEQAREALESINRHCICPARGLGDPETLDVIGDEAEAALASIAAAQGKETT